MGNWHFPLIAHKAGVRTFDLSSGMNYVSMKDQVVRATTLVNCLIKSNVFSGPRAAYDLVVVGAGAAGVAAACHAAGHGLHVLVLESAKERFHLQKQCTSRHVSFSMYDWPEAHASAGIFPSLDDLPVKSTAGLFFPCEVTQKDPVVAQELVRAWDKRIDTHVFEPGAIVWKFGAVAEAPPAAGNVLLIDESTQKTRTIKYRQDVSDHTVTTRIIIFATGIGIERSVPGSSDLAQPYHPPPFWSDLTNPPWESGKDVSDKTVVISGAGDGAIQDFLKVIYRERAKDLLLLANECKLKPQQLSRIVSAERHVGRQLLWDTSAQEAHSALQIVYDEIAKTLLRRKQLPIDLDSLLATCPKIVWVANTTDISKKHITFSKSYPLNRFLATLTLAMLHASPKLELVAGEIASVDACADGSYSCTMNGGRIIRSNFLPLLRHGVEKSLGLGKNKGYFGLRTALAGAPLPFKPSDFPIPTPAR